MQATMTQQQVQRDRSAAAWMMAPLGGATMCGVLSLFVYAATLCPTVSNRGDAGELAAASHLLGIGHPSGYPLFMMIGKLFEHIPVGSLIVRFNLISAVFGALTVAVVFLVTRLLTKSPTAPVLASLIFAFSPSFWGQAEFAEVYTLNAFFFASVLYAALRWHQCADERWLFVGALMFGLGLTNHMTIALLAPGLLVFLIADRRRAARLLQLAVAFMLAGCALNLYMPIRAAHHPALDGGYVSESLGFAKMFFGKSYLKEFIKDTPNEIGSGVVVFATIMAMNFLVVLVPLGLAGGLALWREQRAVALALALAFAPLPPFYILYGQPGVQYFLIPSFLVFALWVGVGWDLLAMKWPRLGASALLGVSLIQAQFWVSLPVCTARNDTISGRYAESILECVKPNATVIVNDDIIAWPLYYYRYAEERRPDVKIVFDHHGPAWRQTIRDNWNRGPVYTAFWYHSVGEGNMVIPDGPLGRVVRSNDLPAADHGEGPRAVKSPFASNNKELIAFDMDEVNLAPRQLTTLRMVWELYDRPQDWEVAVMAERRGTSAGSGMMRMGPRRVRFEEARPIGESFANYGAFHQSAFGTLVRHDMLLTIPEDAEPGVYDLSVALRRKGESNETKPQKVGEFKVWSIRSSQPF